jgi:chitodextrinase
MRYRRPWLLPARATLLFVLLTVVVAGSSAARGDAAPSGLVAAYSFDAGAGTTVADASGNGNDGAISGATWHGSGKSDGALSFDGDDWVTVADAPSLDLSGAMTLEAWVKPSGSGTTWRTVLAKERASGVAYALYARQSSSRPAASVRVSSTKSAVGAVLLPLDTWSHLSATYDGTRLRMFVNGVESGSAAVSGSIRTSSGPLRIGGMSGHRFVGLLDDVRIYNRALTAAELQADMNAPVAPPQGDTAAPTAPTGLGVGNQTQSSVTLTWSASSDNVGVTGYGRYRDGTIVDSGTGTSYTFAGLSCGTSYTLAVDAYDAAGNRSSRSSVIASTAACADTSAPSAPTGLVAGGQTQTEITLTWSPASDNVGVTGYGRYRDGTLVGSGSGTSYAFTGLSCGTSYQLAVDAYDGAGNRSSRSSLTASTSVCSTASSLVAAYSFDAGSGSTVADLSGRGNGGTLFGPTWTDAGKSGGGLSFDGVDDLVTVADAASLDLSAGMTLEAWVRPTTNASWRTVVTKEQTGNLVYGLFANSDTAQPSGIVSIGSSPIQDIVRGPGALALSTWQHLATTYDGSALRLYVGGVQVATHAVSGAMPNSSGPLQIGGNRVWSEWFQGQIDDLRVYDRALSQAELQADMATPVAPPPPPPPADTTPPSVPAGVSVGSATQSSLLLSWSPSSDNVGVTGYGYYRNGSLVGNGTGTSYTFAGLACGSSYTLGVDAYDAAGNRSARASVSGSTAACSPTPTPPPSGSAANLWVDPSGGSCVRQASPGAYADAQACSWNQAYQAAQTGDLVLVRGGSYGDVNIGPNKSSIGAAGVTFRTASGEQVVVGEFENGAYWNNGGGANNLTLVGPIRARSFIADFTSNIVVDGWTVDCEGCIGVQTFHISDVNNVVVRNSDIGNNLDNSLVFVSGSNISFENNRIHDAGLRSGSGAHTECMYVWQTTNLTLKRNHFYRCAIMDVFITGSAVANGGYIENNIFEKPSPGSNAFHFRNGGDPSPDPSNWDFRYNTFLGPLSFSTSENPVGSGGVRLIGNAFLSTAPSCNHVNTTWSHNAFISNPCGPGAITNTLTTYLAGFTNTTTTPGTYTLTSTSILIDKGSTATYPPTDRSGVARYSGTAPDIGAYEYIGT